MATDARMSMGEEPAASLWQGKTICQYRLVREIGRGSGAVVYRAEDQSLERPVALKLLPKRTADPENDRGYIRFINEARSSASLDHENIVRIYEIGHQDGWLFIAMELVPGTDLERLVSSAGPIDVRRACLIGAEAAQALAYAHQMGIIHRDVKPGNMILARNGQCKLTDFGLAHRLDELGAAEPEHRAVGTPHYMAPEVACGKPATPASDVYSLGATIWHLLAGRPVFEAPHTRALVMKHIREPVPDLTRLRPEIDPNLAQVLERALAKRPQERWAADQLARVLWGLTIPASTSSLVPPHGVPTEPRGIKASRVRREVLMPLIATALGLLIAVGAIYAGAVAWTHPSHREAALAEGLASMHAAQGAAPAQAEPGPPTLRQRAMTAAPRVAGVVAASDTARLRAIVAAGDTQRYAVYGKVSVAQTSPTGKSFRISFEPDTALDGFYVVAFPGLFDELEAAFGGRDGSGLLGREVAVVGRLSEYRHRPQIKLDSAKHVLPLDEPTPAGPAVSRATTPSPNGNLR